jgi:hypothetical protein
MNEQEEISGGKSDSKPEQTDEIGNELETGDEVNAAIEQQGDDAAAGIPRDTDAAKQERKKEKAGDDNKELAGAP